jgi:predicted RNA-binding protein YlqC (UPF0109 family)
MNQINRSTIYCLFSKTENRKVKQVCLEVDTSGKEENIRKGGRRVNAVKILCTLV